MTIDITQLDLAVLEAMYKAMKKVATEDWIHEADDNLIIGLAQVSAAIDIVKQRETVNSN